MLLIFICLIKWLLSTLPDKKFCWCRKKKDKTKKWRYPSTSVIKGAFSITNIWITEKKSILKVQGFWLKKFDQASNKSFAKVSMELFSI